jgi:GT2 family glycosyltransferase
MIEQTQMDHSLLNISQSSRQMILPILVLYNVTLESSTTFQTFITSARYGGLDPTLIAVYDNSPVSHVNSGEEAHLFAYKHDPSNGGIAAAYNWALGIARSHGYSWLLLLDQDSSLPITFQAFVSEAVRLYSTNNSVVAIVPRVTDRGGAISPKRVRFGRLAPLPEPGPQVADYEVAAINSGTVVKVSFVESLGGFNQAYWLDCLDHWLFRQIYAHGKKVALSASVLEHNLAGSDYRNQISLVRYESILSAEELFVTTEKRRAEILVYIIRLMARALKQLVIYRRPELAELTCTKVIKMIKYGA